MQRCVPGHIIAAMSDSGDLEKILDTPLCHFPCCSGIPKWVKVRHLVTLLKQVPEILPSPFYLEHRDRNQLRDGDVIFLHQEGSWQSYAIVSSVTSKKAICFANKDKHPMRDTEALLSMVDVRLQEVDLDKVLGSDHGVVGVARQTDREATLTRAKAEVGRPFQFFCFNSEHFATLAVSGTKKSPQIDNLCSESMKVTVTGIVAEGLNPETSAMFQKCAKFLLGASGPEAAKSAASNFASVSAIPFAIDFLSQPIKHVPSPMMKAMLKDPKLMSAILTENSLLSKLAWDEMGRALVPQMAKQTTRKATEGVASGAIATSSKVASGLKTTALIGTAVEGACLVYTAGTTYNKYCRNEISWGQFQRHMVTSGVAAGGSIAGSTVGAAIGSFILPVGGTFVGGLVGGVLGKYMGSKGGEKVGQLAFE